VGLWSSDMEAGPARAPQTSTRASENGRLPPTELKKLAGAAVVTWKETSAAGRLTKGAVPEKGWEVVEGGGEGGVAMLKGEEGRCLSTA
jgi:hypothetical protein